MKAYKKFKREMKKEADYKDELKEEENKWEKLKKNIPRRMNKRKRKTTRKEPKKIEKDMTFGEVMAINPRAMEILAKEGMFCRSCPMAMFETIEFGAKAHKIELDKLLKKLNKKNDS